MQFNENTYQYMKKASFQLEGITCALAVYIENTGDVVREYHYRVYNEFVNDVREKHIDAVREIKDIFEETRCSIESMASTICASSLSKVELISNLEQFEDTLSRLVIHSENIRKCESNTENPFIANASDEIYRSFSGYKRLIEDYPLSEPNNSEDVVSQLIYAYFNESIKVYENLFEEYGKMLSTLGCELEVRRSSLTQKSVAQKRIEKIDNAITAAKVAKEVGGVVGAVIKGDVFKAVDNSIGICASLAEKFVDVVPKESAARKLLDTIETVGKTRELVDNLFDVVDPEIKSSAGYSCMKLLATTSLLRNDGVNIQQMKESGKLDVLINTAGLTSNIIKVATTGDVCKRLHMIPEIAKNGVGLYKSSLKYYHKNNIHMTPKPIDDFLHKQGEKMCAYNDDIAEYKEKVKIKVPVKKPKAPGWMKVHSGLEFTAMAIEKGGIIYDNVKEIL